MIEMFEGQVKILFFCALISVLGLLIALTDLTSPGRVAPGLLLCLLGLAAGLHRLRTRKPF